MNAVVNTWPVQDAKARFSELLARSIEDGPQLVTKHGRAAAVLVPIRQWNAIQAGARPTLKDLLLDRTRALDFQVPARGGLKLRKL